MFVYVLDCIVAFWQPHPTRPPPPSPLSFSPSAQADADLLVLLRPLPSRDGGNSPFSALLLSVDKAAASFPVQPWEPQVSTLFYCS